MIRVEKRFNTPIDELLVCMYYDDELTLAEIGEKFGVSTSTIWFWMRRLGIFEVLHP